MEKKIDAIKMMREIRDKLSETYIQDPKKEIEELKKIREELNLNPRDFLILWRRVRY